MTDYRGALFGELSNSGVEQSLSRLFLFMIESLLFRHADNRNDVGDAAGGSLRAGRIPGRGHYALASIASGTSSTPSRSLAPS